MSVCASVKLTLDPVVVVENYGCQRCSHYLQSVSAWEGRSGRRGVTSAWRRGFQPGGVGPPVSCFWFVRLGGHVCLHWAVLTVGLGGRAQGSDAVDCIESWRVLCKSVGMERVKEDGMRRVETEDGSVDVDSCEIGARLPPSGVDVVGLSLAAAGAGPHDETQWPKCVT